MKELQEMKVGIVGGGTVGYALGKALNEHVKDLAIYDVIATRRTALLTYTLNSDLVFICLPEHEVEPFFARLSMTSRIQTSFVLRSTVPVGTTKRLSTEYTIPHLCHSPEFLTERCAILDAQSPSRNVIGMIDPNNPNEADRAILHLYTSRWPHVPRYGMWASESEAVKLLQNAFFAVKVAFWNEANSFCQALGLDWTNVLTGILMDGRIHPSHTQVPGPDGQRGFGGKCLPKDLQGLIAQMVHQGLVPHVCTAALLRNTAIDRRTP